MDYRKYLKSRHWQRVRKAALKRAGYRCQICAERGLTLSVHHSCYDRRGRELAQDVVVLCENCHRLYHDHLVSVEKKAKELIYA